MSLDIAKHRNIFIKILKDIYTDNTIGSILGFKGGTAAYLFYNLERFSVDLDFDLLEVEKEDYVFERIEKIISAYGTVKTKRKKYYTLFFELSYEEKEHNVKIEISRRNFASIYEVINYFGISMKVMIRKDMFANKMLAMHERLERTNRDIYDVWFFLKNDWPINIGLVEERSKMPFEEFLSSCIEKLEKLPDRSILAGIGELLTEKQKKWAKENLKTDTLFLLKLLLSNQADK
ncbi:MAG: nucleotidyl transferase AbiEii/AbiGii toxin family protein [Parcubacteria group bacterium]|nr:nucleotidyl transferase AbiEii/AbiGii toxin family protein [Parcubacteria group bacterium]